MGIPGAGKSRVAAEHVARGYVRLNRDERGGTLARHRGRPRRAAVVRHAERRSRQHVPDAGNAQPRHRGCGAAWSRRALYLARHAPRTGAGQPRRAAARALRPPADSRGASRAGADSSRACSLQRRRCGRSASSSRRTQTRASPASSRSHSNGLQPREELAACSSRQLPWSMHLLRRRSAPCVRLAARQRA